MRKAIAILLCRLSKWALKLIGRGSSMPGRIALKIYPDILSNISYPENIIAVTGSNGKTTTVEMINEVLSRVGYSVAYNVEGSNLLDGAATLILDNCSLNGDFNKDVLLLETDERYCQYIFKYVTPKYFVITNIYRDQMSRNGNPEFVLGEIKKGIKEGSTLILDSDDPAICALSKEFENECYFYGVGETPYVYEKLDSIYNDDYYCPECKHKMIYEYHHFAHVGKYRCPGCGFDRHEADVEATDLNLEKKTVEINGKHTIKMAMASLHNVYNILSAFSVCKLVGVEEEKICASLNDYLIVNGRIKNFKDKDKEGTLLISKHENSISYNQNLKYVTSYDGDVSVIIIVDAISRKYFTSETSWLWDISFELLQSDNVKQIVVSGCYASDVALRMEYAGVADRMTIIKDIKEAADYLSDNAIGHIFLLTCFSDEFKFMKEVSHD
ncbi:MAG: MurT ligase domain-containing protein [Erysipelotrichaceae bacterium]|nr:MurT ligase domain-containing protein [Erysipelotrichaceae bacterium]